MALTPIWSKVVNVIEGLFFEMSIWLDHRVAILAQSMLVGWPTTMRGLLLTCAALVSIANGMLPPWWILNDVKPEGEPEDMGSYSIVTFSKEQQEKFAIDAHGEVKDQGHFQKALHALKESKPPKSPRYGLPEPERPHFQIWEGRWVEAPGDLICTDIKKELRALEKREKGCGAGQKKTQETTHLLTSHG